MKEVWKDIKDFRGLYKISSFGRVISLPRNGTKKDTYFIKPSIDRYGYIRYSLSKNNKQYHRQAHRLVAEAFIPNPNNKPQVNHIDGKKHNNRVDNLEWNTASENISHRVYKLNGFSVKPKRKIYCLETKEVFPSIRAASRWLQYPHSDIVIHLQGKSKHCKGFHFKYIDN